jgi:hypothetical protein
MNQLNKGQAAVSQAFAEFLFSTDPYFVVSGPAGTGKTFLMDYLSNKGLQEYSDACKLLAVPETYLQTAFTATTNKAAEVLETSIGKPVQTIHSFLGLKVKENFRTGKTEITKTHNWKVRRNMVLFIDECSMIDSVLFQMIVESFEDSKIVFVGDHAQMAPVGEEVSPIYTQISQQNFCRLFEPVRNADSPALMDLCAQLRDTVETGIFTPIQEVPGVVDYLNDAQMEAELAFAFKDLDPPARMLCYTNERVNVFNEHIRTEVRHLPLSFTPGDVVVVARAYQSGKISFSVERELTIAHVTSEGENDHHKAVLGEWKIKYVDIAFKGMTFPDGDPLYIPVCTNPNVLDYALKAYASKKNWSAFFDLKAQYLDIRDKASCTVYKSQGSTYDTVFIDIGNIGTSFDAQQVARMLYVAVSRARHRVCLYGQLPSRYHSSQGTPLWIPKNGPNTSLNSSVPETSVA